jgi:hypothetical protein
MVADQIFGGLYGAIIVDEPEAESGPIPITRERVLVISDISLNASGSIRPPWRWLACEAKRAMPSSGARPRLHH